MKFMEPQNPDFPVNTSFQTALAALLANDEAISNAGALNAEYLGYLQSCAETANRSLLAALSMLNRLSAVNMEAAAHCQIHPDEVAEALRDLTATVSEAAPVLMMKAVDLAVECEKARGKS